MPSTRTYPQCFPPAPPLKLENYEGDNLKYWDFKLRFERHIEEVYSSVHERIASLDSLCVGKAHDLIADIGCLMDIHEAYDKALDRLDKKFRDEKKIIKRLREELLEGLTIKDGRSEALLKLSPIHTGVAIAS